MSKEEMQAAGIEPIENIPDDLDVLASDERKENIVDAFKDLIDNLDEPINPTAKAHWETIRISTRQYINMFKSGDVETPDFQRLEVWNDEKAIELYDSISRGWPIGGILISEVGGTKLLTDGLQRSYALTKLSYGKYLNTQQQCEVLNSDVLLEIAHVKTHGDAKELFRRRNSQIILAAVVKERSKLPEELNQLVVSMSGIRFFRDLKLSASFNKGQHNELIVMNCLLASSGVQQVDNKAKNLVKALLDHKEVVIAHSNDAMKNIKRIETIYKGIDCEVTKRSMNANYISSLLYVMANYPDFTDAQIVAMTETIFKEARAVKWYSETTSSGAADSSRCRTRQDRMIDFLRNNGEKAAAFNEEQFVQWVKNQGNNPICAHDDKTIVPFSAFEYPERIELFMAQKNNKPDAWDKVVYAVYNRDDMKQSA